MISVVIPAYNEADAVGETVRTALRAMDSAGIRGTEVVVVDDGSTDKTAEVARKAGARIVSHPQRAGYGCSLKDGIRAAEHNTIVIIDADGTYPVKELPLLVKTYEDGYDMVVGARQGEHYHQSFMKKLSRSILKALVEFASGSEIADINSGMRVFSRSTIMSCFSRLCDSFSFTTSLTLAYVMMGRFVAHVPVPYDKRVGTSKVRHVRDALRTMQFIVEAVVFYNPLKMFMLFVVMLMGVSLCGFIASLLMPIKIGYIIGIGSFLMAILMFGVGLLAVLLKQIMHQVGAEDKAELK